MIIGRSIATVIGAHNVLKTGVHGVGTDYLTKTPTAAQTLPLSSLVIDTDKDWNEKSISNFKNLALITGGYLRIEDTLANDLEWSGIVFEGTAGEDLAQFETVYRKNDGKYWKAKADAVGTMPVIAMATVAISADATGIFLLIGWIRSDAWSLTAGQSAYQSAATGGAVTTTQPAASGNQVQRVGIALTTKIAHFNPM